MTRAPIDAVPIAERHAGMAVAAIEAFGCHIYGGSYFQRTGWSSASVSVDL